MSRTSVLISSLLCAAAGAIAADGVKSESAGPALKISAGAAYRGGMKLKVKGGDSYAAQNAAKLLNKKSGKKRDLQDSEYENSDPHAYNGGAHTFTDSYYDEEDPEYNISKTIGSVDANGVAEGGYNSGSTVEMYEWNTTWTRVDESSYSETRLSSTPSSLCWDDDTFNGVGFTIDAELPIIDIDNVGVLSGFVGFRGYYGMDATAKGMGANVSTKTSTTKYDSGWKYSDSKSNVSFPIVDNSGVNPVVDLNNATVDYDGGDTWYYGNGPDYGDIDNKGKTSSSRSVASSVAKIDMDADMYQVALGVGLACGFDGFSFSFRPSLLLNTVDADVTRTETFTSSKGKVLGTWRDSESETKFKVGLGLNVEASVAIVDGWSFFVAGGYEFIDPVEVGIGPNTAKMDFSAYTVSAGVEYKF